MIELNHIRMVLMTMGISRLKIDFDDEQKLVNADYVFGGVSYNKQITYQEIIDSLTIGQPEVTTCPILDEPK